MDNHNEEKQESWKVKTSKEDRKKERPKPYDRDGEKNKDLATKKEDPEKCKQTKDAACSSKRDNEIAGQPAILAEFTQNTGSSRIVLQGSQFVYEHQGLPRTDPSQQEDFDRETDELLEVMQHVDGDYGYEPNNYDQQEEPREKSHSPKKSSRLEAKIYVSEKSEEDPATIIANHPAFRLRDAPGCPEEMMAICEAS